MGAAAHPGTTGLRRSDIDDATETLRVANNIVVIEMVGSEPCRPKRSIESVKPTSCSGSRFG
jgi:hypothetical protein